ncbi:MAG: energy-coupling factor ABC transporter permease [Planctomycetota bacterium]|jgi:cobalt/nickel transport system permease protein
MLESCYDARPEVSSVHMGNELLTLPVAAGTFVAAGAGVAYASCKARDELDEKRIPLLGVLGAFVFAAQMVNFPILPCTSGHFVGAALLAIVLGPHAAALGMTAIVIVECLVFQDGGLLALGANVVNMAIVGPYVAWGVFRLIVPSGSAPGSARLYGASFLAAFASILAGATILPLEVALSGVLAVPLHVFLRTMVGVHALIGAAEGAITFAVLVALARMRPGLVPGARAEGGWPLKTALASILAAALVTGGLLSLAASSSPDGLESAVEAGLVIDEGTPNAAAEGADYAGERIALIPDYGERWYLTSLSGVLGALLVLGLGAGVARALSRRATRHAGPASGGAG